MRARDSPSPLVFFLISMHFTATLGIPVSSHDLKSCSFKGRSPVEPGNFTPDLQDRLYALYAVNPNNVRSLRITAAAGTELAGASSGGTVNPRDISPRGFFPPDSGLQPEGLHPARGVARSGFPPLPKPLDCCLP